jgi:hypothetical protein
VVARAQLLRRALGEDVVCGRGFVESRAESRRQVDRLGLVGERIAQPAEAPIAERPGGAYDGGIARPDGGRDLAGGHRRRTRPLLEEVLPDRTLGGSAELGYPIGQRASSVLYVMCHCRSECYTAGSVRR